MRWPWLSCRKAEEEPRLDALRAVMDAVRAASQEASMISAIEDLRQELCNRKHQIVCLKGENKKLRAQLNQLKQEKAGL